MPRKIMICDDDEGLLEMMEMMLDEFGYAVITESKSTMALKTLEEQMPDLLLLDIWMPVIAGDQVLKNIKLNPKVADIPVIMYSASAEGAKIAAVVGANDFIAKPFDLEEMEKKIKKLLH
ncbi:response regulator [Pedobacter sp. SL55]|uniref:response regulator n=1 Tax=Pedobacter sp. SL55 TaxID=2995161 RepID=UPI0022706DB7|nr:response regulator [Pedobacter sp. SL55]WAC41040.1 response regulator [Pedobacter sp. SL55]